MGLFDKIFGKPAKSVQNPASVWSAQAPYLQSVYQAGQGLQGEQMAAGSEFQQQRGMQGEAWQNLLSGSANPYLSGMASSAMAGITKQFQEQIMPALLGGGNAAGQLGGERYQLLQDSAVDSATRAMGDVSADIYGRAWDSGLQAQLGALDQSGNVMGSAWQPLLSQAKLVGGPTVLGGGGTSTGGSEGILGTLAKFKPSGGGSWFGG